MFYILDGDRYPVKANNPEWTKFMSDTSNRVVKQERILWWDVSTVFLGIDHGFSSSDRTPVLWETMVFRHRSFKDVEQRRYKTYSDAVMGHEQIAFKYRMAQYVTWTIAAIIAVATVLVLQ